MKALSIRQPYITEILGGLKEVEYRSWQTPYRGDLLLCASVSRADAPKEIAKHLVFGHAIGIANLYDIKKAGDKDYHWLLKDIRFIDPIPIKGKLHLFDVDDSLIKPLKEKDIYDVWASKGLVSKEGYQDQSRSR